MKPTARPYLSLVAAVLIVATASADRPPNIVLLIGDDHGYPYYGFMGDDNVVTPSMDALAAGGVTFSHGHVTASYCRPSLRTLITGLHPVQYVQRKAEILDRRRRDDPDYANLDDAETAQPRGPISRAGCRFRGRIDDWKREIGMANPVIIHE